MTKDLLGIGFDMLFSELYKIMVDKFTFVGFREGDCPPWIRHSLGRIPVT